MTLTPGGATERPWAAVETGWQPWEGAIQILGADGQIIGYLTSGANEKQNAALLVAAVNSYNPSSPEERSDGAKPAPDAMREHVTRLKEIGNWLAVKGNAHDASALYSIARAISAPEGAAEAPSSPAHFYTPHNSGERLPSSDAAEGAGETPSDDVRSALADRLIREVDRLHAYVLHHYTCATTGHDRTKFERDLASIVKGLRSEIAALRSTPVSAPANGDKS